MKNFIGYIFSFLLIMSVSFAQKVSLTGKVSDTKEGTPLVGANVYLAGTSLGTATNEDGNYTISGISQGTYVVKVTYIGYTTLEDSIIINEEDETKDFVLSYTSIQGEVVVVTG